MGYRSRAEGVISIVQRLTLIIREEETLRTNRVDDEAAV